MDREAELHRRLANLPSVHSLPWKYLGKGVCGDVREYADEHGTALVVKRVLRSHGRHASIQDVEREVTCELWRLFVKGNITPHLVRPYGVLVEQCGDERLELLALERLTGFCSGTMATPVMDLIGLFDAVATNQLPHAEFDMLLRGTLFQVLYTLCVLADGTGSHFRHNDLHLGNVALTRWDAVPRSYCVDTDGVQRWFTLTTPVRAVIIDYGWAAFQPPLGKKEDDRFANRDPAVVKMLNDCGMTNTLPSKHYDAAMFMFAVYVNCRRALRAHTLQGCTLRAVASPPPIMQEFVSLFDALYRPLRAHMQWESHLPAQSAGRLTLAAQMMLRQHDHLQLDGQRSVLVPHPAMLLAQKFFTCYRSEGGTGACYSLHGCTLTAMPPNPSCAYIDVPMLHQCVAARCSRSTRVMNEGERRFWLPKRMTPLSAMRVTPSSACVPSELFIAPSKPALLCKRKRVTAGTPPKPQTPWKHLSPYVMTPVCDELYMMDAVSACLPMTPLTHTTLVLRCPCDAFPSRSPKAKRSDAASELASSPAVACTVLRPYMCKPCVFPTSINPAR